MSKILLVEDDADLRNSLEDFLKTKHLTVDGVNCISDAREYLMASEYDVLILDWNLPDGVGVDLLAEIRGQSNNIPTLMFTTRATIHDKIVGFRAGTDDYLCKPFHPEELFMRVEALLRRPKQLLKPKLTSGLICMDLQARKVTRNGQELRLTPKEFSLLEFFLKHPDQVFSVETLLERVWSTDSESTTETVGATVLRLRKKIDSPGEPTRLRNVFGSGYIFDGSRASAVIE